MKSNSLLKKSSNRGFSLIEMVVVMGIIAVLIGGVVGLMGNFGNSAKVQKAGTDINGIQTSLKIYQVNAKTYPSTAQGLDALVTKPTSSPKPKMWVQVFPELPLDPWQNPYIYENNSGKITLRSKGPDGQDKTEDDIKSEY
ncbi:type II secretion system major pseudopilin GspG [Akkermansiaceae bacterium]|nr:type II secretion system major pseudopilin GspG [Akkermansiaceae bacterium]